MRRKIKELAEITIGYQHRGAPLSMGSEGTHKVIQIKDLDKEKRFVDEFPLPAENRLFTGDLYRATPSGKVDSYEVHNENVLFLSRGARYVAIPLMENYVWPFPPTWEGIIASYHFYILRLREGEVTPEYLAWALNNERTQAAMEAVSQGSHMKLIKKEDFGEVAIDVPSLDTQCQIIGLHHLALTEWRLMQQIQQKRAAVVASLCARVALENL